MDQQQRFADALVLTEIQRSIPIMLKHVLVRAFSPGFVEKLPIESITMTHEPSAGFAADAYSRLNGIGLVCVTYCVGGLSLANSIAGAFAEKSPVVVISGSPGLNERINNPLLHHKVRDFHTQLQVFEKLCIAVTELNDPMVAFSEIDREVEGGAYAMFHLVGPRVYLRHRLCVQPVRRDLPALIISVVGFVESISVAQTLAAKRRGVIFDIDPVFANSEEWYQSIPEDLRPPRDQPFYHLLAENAEASYVAYVSQQNLVADDSDEPIDHPAIGTLFASFDEGRYRLRPEHRH